MEVKNANIRRRIKYFVDNQNITQKEFFEKTNLNRGLLDTDKLDKEVGGDKITNILVAFPDLNVEWLMLGKGEMLKTKSKENATILEGGKNGGKNGGKPNVKEMPPFTKTTSKRSPLTAEKAQELQNIASGAFLAQKPKLIPVYGVSTIGGTNIGADMSPVSEPEGYIEAGGWFPSVTAAIYHYGDSMEEYPAGVLLALQEVYNRRNIIWGSNYVIETSEMRITKRLQTCPDDKSYVMAYSSNKETYPDGRLVHEPITIHKEDITRLFLVIGVIKKEQMSAPILIKPSKGHKEL